MMTGAGWGIGPGGGLWTVLELVVAIVVIAAVVWLIVDTLPWRHRSTTDDAEVMIKARFARGEMTEAEYVQARHLLGIG